MKHLVEAVLFLTLASCGLSGHQDAQETQLQLLVSDMPITMQAGQTLALQLLVIGAGSEQATISSPDLPPFATLQGSRLTLSPSRQYEGDYTLTLVASTQSSTASASLRLTVQRPETAPRPQVFFLSATNGDNLGGFCLDLPTCVLYGTPIFYLSAVDDEGDPVTWDIELVSSEQPFSGSPTQTLTQPVTRPPYPPEVQMPFSGLTVGQSYSFAVRCRDGLGAACSWSSGRSSGQDGWLRGTYGFVQGPAQKP